MSLKLKKKKQKKVIKKKTEEKPPPKPRVIMTVDASLNGTGIWICDENFNPIDWFLFTTKAGIANGSPGNTHRVQEKGYERILIARRHFNKLIYKHSPDFIIFEEYTFGRRQSSGLVFNIAEFTGQLRLAAYEYCRARGTAHMRTVIPSVPKKWATGNGAADKEMMLKAAIGDVGRGQNISLAENVDFYGDLPEEIMHQDDIADPYCLANYFIHELMIRDGKMTAGQMKSKHGINAECFFPKSSKKGKKPRIAPYLQEWIV